LRVGTIRFRLDGRSVRLTAYKERREDAWLYVPFRDLTSGGATDPAGRFLTIPAPASAQFLLDFNRARNTACAYSAAFDCPVTPAENDLDVAVEAGEKRYPLPE
jgi:uncharacterized protein (DUF1684 family)